MKLKVLFLFLLAFGLGQISFGQNVALTTDNSRGYLIGPGDVLTIKVLGERVLDVDAVTVDEDGKIQFPLKEEGIPAKCRTEKELGTDISAYLAKYLKNPQVSVYVKERNSCSLAMVDIFLRGELFCLTEHSVNEITCQK